MKIYSMYGNVGFRSSTQPTYYKNPSDIIVKIFDERRSISNPGKLYGKLNISDLKRDDYVSSLRNRLLAETFFLTGDIECYGTGFVRIREYLQSYPDVELFVADMSVQSA